MELSALSARVHLATTSSPQIFSGLPDDVLCEPVEVLGDLVQIGAELQQELPIGDFRVIFGVDLRLTFFLQVLLEVLEELVRGAARSIADLFFRHEALDMVTELFATCFWTAPDL